MPLAVDALLAGPRGRRFCLELVLSGEGQDTDEGAKLWQLLFHATHRLESARGQAGTLFGPGVDEPLPNPSVADIASALDKMPMIVVNETNSLEALAAAVDSARYWQEPDGTDGLLAAAGILSALERIAAHTVASPSISWWSGPVASDQWSVQFTDSGQDVAMRLPAEKALLLWRDDEVENEQTATRKRPADPHANWTGEWWSKPAVALTKSTRTLRDLGPMGLSLIEDRFGWKKADTERLHDQDPTRICEITDTDVWAELCWTYPLDVTATRRHDWYRVTGRSGRWVIPDWSRVSRDFDAVHLSTFAYLSSAGIVIKVDGDAASMIAGWNPDETYWLTDVSSDPTTRTSWTLDNETGHWRVTEAR
jgi:hypothetical protein